VSGRPGIRKAHALRTREQELEEQLAETRRARAAAEQEAESGPDEDPLAPERSMFHAAFVAVVDELDLMGWSRRRTARFFKIHGTTLFELYNEGFRRRKQLQGHCAVRCAMLPERAFLVWRGLEDSWRREALLRTGTDG
jgi:hypothetical protein